MIKKLKSIWAKGIFFCAFAFFASGGLCAEEYVEDTGEDEGWPDSYYEDGYADFYSGNYDYSTPYNEDSSSYASWLNEALSAYAEAVAANAPAEELAALQTYVDAAKDAMDNYCSSHGLTYSVGGDNAVTVYNFDGMPVGRAGDPVIISSGIFILEDSDISLQAGNCSFDVKRALFSGKTFDSADFGRFFGQNWISNLDTRIIRGYSQKLIDEYPNILSAMETLRQKVDVIKSYADEDSNCTETYEKAKALLEEAESNLCLIEAEISRSKSALEKNAHVLYGVPGKLGGGLKSGCLIFVDESGTPIIFERVLNDESEYGDYAPKNKKFVQKYSLFCDSNGFCLSNKITGEKKYFDSCGLPSKFVSMNKGSVFFEYDSEHRLKAISLDKKRTFRLLWNGDRLSSVSDGLRSVSYKYAAGKLSAVTDWESDTKRFAYDTDGNLLKQIKADGSFVGFAYTKFNDGLRTVSTTDENGATEHFAYNIEGKQTIHTDHDGVKAEYKYDERGLTVYERFSDGSVFYYEYDENDRLSKKRDNHSAESFSYDADGNLLSRKYSDGSSEEWTYSQGKIASYKDRDGVSIEFSYDSNGNQTGVYRKGQLVNAFEYDSNNLLCASKDCFENRTVYSYNEWGDLVEKSLYAKNSIISAATEKWVYDSIGRIQKYTDAAGRTFSYKYAPHAVNISVSTGLEVKLCYSSRKDLISKTVSDTKTGEKRVYEYEYDKMHRLVCSYVSGIDSQKNQVPKTKLNQFAYTSEGRLSSHRIFDALTAAGENPKDDCWFFDYSFDFTGNASQVDFGFGESAEKSLLSRSKDERGILFTETLCDGRKITQLYDKQNRLVSETENGTEKYKYDFSPAGRLLKISWDDRESMQFAYDSLSGRVASLKAVYGNYASHENSFFPNGFVKSSKGRDGKTCVYEYDVFGNVCKISSESKSIETAYDSVGRVTSHRIKNAEGKIVSEESFEYSDDFRFVTRIKGGLFKEKFVLNAFSETVAIVDADGNKKSFDYDVLGRLCRTTDAYGNSTCLEYDGMNHLVKKTFADGSFKKYVYDHRGNCIEIRDSLGKNWCGTYDASGRLVSSSSRPFSEKECYEYDELDRVVKVRRGGSTVLTNSFGKKGKSYVRKDSRGNESFFGFDGYGRLVSKKDRLGNLSESKYNSDGTLSEEVDFNGKKALHSYSAGGLTHNVTYSDGTFEKFTFDAAGNLLSAINSDSALYFSYDCAGHLVSQYDEKTCETVNFTYDARGLLSKIQGAGRNITYIYGKNSELLKIVDSIKTSLTDKVTEVDFSYDKLGREISKSFSTGECEKSFYDGAGRLVLKTGYFADSKLIFLDGSVYDASGAKILSLDSNLGLTRFEYDKMGRIASVSYPYSERVAGHLKKITSDAGLHFKDSDFVSSRLSLNPSEISEIEKLCKMAGLHFSSISLSVNQAVLKESFVYDSEGNMISRTTPFGKIDYSYDKENRLVGWGRGCTASYDKNGNLVQKKFVSKTEQYAYNPQNRIAYATVYDYADEKKFQLSYKYDALGRRTVSSSNADGDTRTVYEGVSLRELCTKQIPSSEAWSSENLNGDSRYAWISDSAQTRSVKTSKPVEPTRSHFIAEAPLYGNGFSPISFASADAVYGWNKNVLLSDSLGSVKMNLSEIKAAELYGYDVFGSPLEEPFSFGFAGKKFDSVTQKYDFGFRDYMPDSSRFTSVDPILDGKNWYTYCAGNPVNYLDPDGLKTISPQAIIMQDSPWGSESLGWAYETYIDSNGIEKPVTVATHGCLVTSMCEVISELFGENVTPHDLNAQTSLFDAQYLNTIKTADEYGMFRTSVGSAPSCAFTDSRFASKLSEQGVNPTGDRWADVINYYNGVSRDVGQILHVEWNTAGKMHFVGTTGEIINRNGTNYAVIVPTSKSDTLANNMKDGKEKQTSRIVAGWHVIDGKMCVPTSLIHRVDVYTQKDFDKVYQANKAN